jgi:Xaa-Pro aminopeptidase
MIDTSVTTPRAEIETRTETFQVFLRSTETDGALILQKADLFYFAGTIQQAVLYIPAEGNPVLMVRKSVRRAQTESPLSCVVALNSTRQIPALIADHGLSVPKVIGLELDVLPAQQYIGFQRLFPGGRLVDVSHGIRMIRAVKSPYEINCIEAAARRADQVAGSVAGLLETGMTEVELAGRVESVARKLGHQGIVRMRLWGNELFYGHLMAGASAAIPSYLSSPTGGNGVHPSIAQGPGYGKIKAGEPILVDYVFAYQGYLADHTRIFSIGHLPEALYRAHMAMLELQETIKGAALPGTPAGHIYELAMTQVRKSGYASHFMGHGERRVRFVGHGIGIELDEYPFLAEKQALALEEGMVVALEPKLVIPGRGVVGVENSHVVTAKGLAQLTRFDQEIITV